MHAEVVPRRARGTYLDHDFLVGADGGGQQPRTGDQPHSPARRTGNDLSGGRHEVSPRKGIPDYALAGLRNDGFVTGMGGVGALFALALANTLVVRPPATNC